MVSFQFRPCFAPIGFVFCFHFHVWFLLQLTVEQLRIHLLTGSVPPFC